MALPVARRGTQPLFGLADVKAMAPELFPYFAALVDVLVIAAAAIICHVFLSGAPGPLIRPGSVVAIGLAISAVFVITTAQREDYDWRSYFVNNGHLRHGFAIWNFAFFAAFAFAFATKTSAQYSRESVGVFYALGLVSVSLSRRAVVDFLQTLQSSGVAPSRRVVIVGTEDKILRCLDRFDRLRDGVDIVSIIAMRDQQAYEAEDLALASAAVRMYRPDDVYLAIPWSRGALLEQCAEAFKGTPAQVHVGIDEVSGLLRQGDVSRIGPMASLRLTRPPMSRIQRFEKRAFDILFALGALVALSPLLLLVAVLIKLDSKGPVLFRQTRYGFNQEPFRIFKFRSMVTMEDGARIRMVTRDDPRVTRLGAFLRRSSIDELPQLLNVLRGEMSIVGPRPHVLSHDQRYVERLSRYARRHNVKPGITGWAQVHGYRGEIRNDEDMQKRLEYDLFYVDNWSLALDIKTVFLTVFSKKTRMNAY